MTTTLAQVTTGDIGRTRQIQLGELAADGTLTVIDFTGTVTSVEAHLSRPGVAAVTVTATMTTESTGIVTVDYGGAAGWLATLDIPAGVTRLYYVEVEVTYTDSNVQTWRDIVQPVAGQIA